MGELQGGGTEGEGVVVETFPVNQRKHTIVFCFSFFLFLDTDVTLWQQEYFTKHVISSFYFFHTHTKKRNYADLATALADRAENQEMSSKRAKSVAKCFSLPLLAKVLEHGTFLFCS